MSVKCNHKSSKWQNVKAAFSCHLLKELWNQANCVFALCLSTSGWEFMQRALLIHQPGEFILKLAQEKWSSAAGFRVFSITPTVHIQSCEESFSQTLCSEKLNKPRDSIAYRTTFSSNKLTSPRKQVHQSLVSLWRNLGPLFFAGLFQFIENCASHHSISDQVFRYSVVDLLLCLGHGGIFEYIEELVVTQGSYGCTTSPDHHLCTPVFDS